MLGSFWFVGLIRGRPRDHRVRLGSFVRCSSVHSGAQLGSSGSLGSFGSAQGSLGSLGFVLFIPARPEVVGFRVPSSGSWMVGFFAASNGFVGFILVRPRADGIIRAHPVGFFRFRCVHSGHPVGR